VRSIPNSELELLLRCARMQVDPEGAARIAGLVSRDLDWERVLMTARHHGLIPLLYRTLASLRPRGLAPPTLQKLRTLSEAIRFQNLVKAKALLDALRALEAAGLAAIPYKGPALAVFLFQDLALREFDDIDLLIERRNAVRAKRVLTQLGYAVRRRIADRWDYAWALLHQEFALAVPHHRFDVDLSWRAGPWYWRLPDFPASMWERLGWLTVLGSRVPWLAAEDLLLILCLHGSKHRWEELKWLVDVAELLRIRPDLDWHRLTDEARRTGSDRMLAVCLLLASDLLDAPVPAEVLDDLRATPSVPSLASDVCDSICEDAKASVGIQARLRFLARVAESADMKVACRLLPFAYFLLNEVLRSGVAALRAAVTR
jgi:hypothetical protein